MNPYEVSSSDESPFNDVELMDDVKTTTVTHCIDLNTKFVNFLLIIIFSAMVFSNIIVSAHSPPEYITQIEKIQVPRRAKSHISFTLTMNNLQFKHNTVEIFYRLKRKEITHGVYSRAAKQKLTITFIDDLKELTYLFNNISVKTITFEPKQRYSNKALLFSHKIDTFDSLEIMLDIENVFGEVGIAEAEINWRVDSQVKRAKTSSSQMMQIVLLFFCLISFLINRPNMGLDVFIVVLLIFGILSANPLLLFYPHSRIVKILLPIFSSIFRYTFMFYCLLDLLRFSKRSSTVIINGIVLLLIAICNIIIEITKHFIDTRYIMNLPNFMLAVFIYHCAYLLYVSYLIRSLSKQSPTDSLSYLPFAFIIIITSIIEIVYRLLELLQKMEPSFYQDISIINSSYTIATCFFSFFQLLVRNNPKDLSKVLVNEGEKT